MSYDPSESNKNRIRRRRKRKRRRRRRITRLGVQWDIILHSSIMCRYKEEL
jgi:hypothetical protein